MGKGVEMKTALKVTILRYFKNSFPHRVYVKAGVYVTEYSLKNEVRWALYKTEELPIVEKKEL